MPAGTSQRASTSRRRHTSTQDYPWLSVLDTSSTPHDSTPHDSTPHDSTPHDSTDRATPRPGRIVRGVALAMVAVLVVQTVAVIALGALR
jgi:hypothetical protein